MIPDIDINEIIQNTSLPKEINDLPILITGGTGFIGSWLVAALDKLIDNQDIDNLIYVLTGDKIKANNVFSRLNKKNLFTVTIGELRSQLQNSSLPGFGYVFHCATSTKYDTNDPRNDFEKTLNLTEQILRVLEMSGSVPNFINLSSGAVYGPSLTKEKLAENDSSKNHNEPLTSYGVTKIRIEEMILRADREGVVKGANPRLFTFFGPGLPLKSHFAIGNFVHEALTRNQIIVTGSPETTRSYLYISDLVIRLFALSTKPTLDVLHIGSKSSINIENLALEVSKVFNNCPIVFKNEFAKPNYYVPEVIKTNTYLKINKEVLLSNGLLNWKNSLLN